MGHSTVVQLQESSGADVWCTEILELWLLNMQFLLYSYLFFDVATESLSE